MAEAHLCILSLLQKIIEKNVSICLLYEVAGLTMAFYWTLHLLDHIHFFCPLPLVISCLPNSPPHAHMSHVCTYVYTRVMQVLHMRESTQYLSESGFFCLTWSTTSSSLHFPANVILFILLHGGLKLTHCACVIFFLSTPAIKFIDSDGA